MATVAVPVDTFSERMRGLVSLKGKF